VIVGTADRDCLTDSQLRQGFGSHRLVLGRIFIAPVAMIADCPAISRGVDATVPIVPGLVNEIVVPWKSEI
jgi:hypothetical protein